MVYTSETPRRVQTFDVFKPPAIEFHLSLKIYKLLMRNHYKSLNSEVIVMLRSNLMAIYSRLFSDEQEVTDKTVYLLNKIFAKAKKLGQLIGYKDKPKVVVNCGGHSFDKFLSKNDTDKRIENFTRNVEKVDTSGCRFWLKQCPHIHGSLGDKVFITNSQVQKIL